MNPSLLPFHGTYSHDHARSPSLYPQLVLSKHVQSNQLLITPLEAFQNVTHRVPWAQKTTSKIFWRGSTTGDFFLDRKDYNWRNSHRIRLHALTNAKRGKKDVLVETKGGKEVEMRRFEVGDLNEHLMDVGLSSIGQCKEEDGTCECDSRAWSASGRAVETHLLLYFVAGDAMRKEIQLAGVVFPHDALLYRYAIDM